MITLLSILVAVWLAGLLMLVIGRLVAPEGYEDDRGFHFGAPGQTVIPATVAVEALPAQTERAA